MTRTHSCFHEHTLLPDDRCEGSETETRVCNTDLCPGDPIPCFCNPKRLDRSGVRCMDRSSCPRGFYCEMNDWFKNNPMDNTFECRHATHSGLDRNWIERPSCRPYSVTIAK